MLTTDRLVEAMARSASGSTKQMLRSMKHGSKVRQSDSTATHNNTELLGLPHTPTVCLQTPPNSPTAAEPEHDAEDQTALPCVLCRASDESCRSFEPLPAQAVYGMPIDRRLRWGWR